MYVCMCICICVCICSRLDEKHFCGFDCEFIIRFAEIPEEFKSGNEKINRKRTQPKIKKRGLKLLRKIPKLGFHTG